MVYTNCINFENNENYNNKKEIMKSTLLSQVGRDWDRWRSRAHKHNLFFFVKFEKIMIDDAIEYNDWHVQ